MVSSAGVTGSQTGFGSAQEDYFKRADMNLKNPQVIGFGINNKKLLSKPHNLPKVLLLVVLLFRI
jgi:tryptophan synthase alpha chain